MLTLEADRSYSAFVMGQLGDNTFRAVIAADNAATGGIGGVPSTGGGGMARAASATPLLAPFVGLLAATVVLLLALSRGAARAACRAAISR